jgi:tetratricopeptide (TPR) repeat protein
VTAFLRWIKNNNKFPNMERIRRLVAALALGLLALPPAAAQAPPSAAQAPPALRVPPPSPAAISLAAAREPLELEALIRGALEFSGATGEELQAARSRLEALIGRAGRAVEGAPSPKERAERLLGFLHAELFRAYDSRQTRLDVALAGGSFNCVSSAVLYAILARSQGLQVWGVRAADHAFARVQAGTTAYDVETTSPYGFDPGSRKEFTDSFGRITGYSYVPPSNYSQRTQIGEKGLLALILYNRMALATEQRAFDRALAPAVDAHALLKDSESRERLGTALANRASACGLAGDYQAGVDFLNEAWPLYPEPRLARLREDLLHNWAVSLIAARRLEEAQRLLDERLARGELPASEWRSLSVTVVQLQAQEAARTDPGRAAELVRAGLARIGPEPALKATYEACAHNQAVSLLRAGRPEEALEAVRRALTLLPGSAVLSGDESLLLRQSSGR